MNIPHFSLPVRYDSAGRIVTVEQDSIDDVTNCVNAAVRTERGTRAWVPEFGITDPTFEMTPVDIKTMQDEISSSEPRAILNLNQNIETSDGLATRIVVGVKNA